MIRKVACAISGGVDSAVSALLLKRRGIDVIGVYMINWDQQDEENSNCSNTKDLADAQAVCRKLGIELRVVNFVKEYWNFVFLNLLENYKIGRTVVPDLDCNKQIKFDLFHKFAFDKLGVDAVATGHFARNFLHDMMKPTGILLTAKDPLKDQTYFLSSLKQEQLKYSIFPVGNILKSKVKEIAKNAELPRVLEKDESMGICFVGKKKNFDSFLLKYIDPVVGNFVDSDTGAVIDGVTHSGIHNFTIGKRIKNTFLYSNCEGLFVSGLDPKTQTVYFCRGSFHPVLYSTKFIVSNLSLVREENRKLIFDMKNLTCRIQRKHPVIQCTINPIENGQKYIIQPKTPLRATTPGQICAFYNEEECLGCAEIHSVASTLANRLF